MPTPTYTLIQEQVLSSAASSVTFTSIPQTYKDLVLEVVGTHSQVADVWMQFNGDTATNYSRTFLYGNGSSTLSGRNTSVAYLYGMLGSTSQTLNHAYLFSYSNTATFKTALMRLGNAGDSTAVAASMWRSASNITSILVGCSAGTFLAGTTFRLYGIHG